MNISQIGADEVFQKISQEQPLPKVSQDTYGTGNADEIKVDIGLPKNEDTSVYDQAGNLIGAKKASDEQQLPGRKDKTDKEGQGLSAEEQQEVRELRARDQEVRAHEMAHAAAGGSLVRGGPHYEYKRGPDGNIYAVGGEVSIDMSGEKTPQQTVQKMQRVQAAALAPADPSGQDRAVAAAAAQKAQAARVEMAQESRSETASAGDQTIQKADSSKQAQSHASYQKASAPGERSKSFHIVI
jgi:hypothetical protein